jgi:diguanylate cyclase (GGDEF)-like protein/PAS domain S-box-containing protein
MIAFTVRYAINGSVERKGIVISVVVAEIGVILHIVFKEDVDYSTLFTALLLMYYLSLYVMTAKEDPLTGLMNRQCYYADSEKLKNQITAVVSVDMNDLKKYNDTQGHDAGDLALRTVSGCLVKKHSKNKRVYRIGGDEFAIFYLGITEEEVQKDIESMIEYLAETPYVCAFGYEMVDKNSRDIHDTMRLADREMYENKAKLKDTAERRIAAHKEATIRVMHEALGSGMWGMEFDESGKMISVEWSPEFRRMIGYTDENDFPNTLEAWSDLLHPDDKEKVLKAFNDAIADYSGQKHYDVKYRLNTKNGGWRKFHAMGRLLRREDGTPLSYVGMFVEIKEQ